MRFLLFDVDGTLINSRGAGRIALEQAFAEVFDLEEVPQVEGRVRFNGALDPEIHAAMAGLLGIGASVLESRRRQLEERYVVRLREACAADEGTILPGVPQLLSALDAHPGVALGLLTGNIEAGARVKLEPHGLNRFFRSGGFGGDGPNRASVAQVAWRRLQQLTKARVPASDVVVIGDSCRDVECGRANRFVTVAVASGWTSREELARTGPDWLLDDLTATGDLIARLAPGGAGGGEPEGSRGRGC